MSRNIIAINSTNYVRNRLINNFLNKKNKFKEINFKGNFLIKNIKLLKIFFLKFDLILINWNSWSSFFIIYLINKIKKKIIIYDAYTLIHEDFCDKYLKKNFFFDFIYQKIEKFIYSNSDILITDTIIHKEKIQKILNYKKKILVLNVSEKKLLKKTIKKSKKIKLLHAGADRRFQGVDKMILLTSRLPNNLKKKIFFQIICKENYDKYKKLLIKFKCEDCIGLLKPLRYNNYLNLIRQTDICLGLFGNSDKTKSVISNFIVTSTNLGKTIITKKTRAAKIYLDNNKGIFLLDKPDQLNFNKFIKKYVISSKFRNEINNKSKRIFLKNFDKKINLKNFDIQLKNFI